jgi:hypothetical protein
MPAHKFRNEKPKTYEILPDGEYLCEVVEADQAFSQGAATRGSEQIDIKLKSVEHGATFFETLIFHPNTDWKVDLFINCFNLAPAKIGEEVQLTPEAIIGCKGWVKVFTDEYNGKKKNKVRTFLTDKEKFPRPQPVAAATAENTDSEPDWS